MLINELQKQVKELQASNVGLQHAVNNTIAITEEVQEHIGALAGLSTDQVTLATLVHDMARDAQQQQKLLQEVSERLVAFIAQSGLDEEQKENLLQSLVPPLQVSSDAQASAGQAVSVLEQQRRVIEHYNKQNFISRFFSSPKPLKTFSQIPVDWLQKHKEWIEKHGCNDICKMRTALV